MSSDDGTSPVASDIVVRMKDGIGKTRKPMWKIVSFGYDTKYEAGYRIDERRKGRRLLNADNLSPEVKADLLLNEKEKTYLSDIYFGYKPKLKNIVVMPNHHMLDTSRGRGYVFRVEDSTTRLDPSMLSNRTMNAVAVLQIPPAMLASERDSSHVLKSVMRKIKNFPRRSCNEPSLDDYDKKTLRDGPSAHSWVPGLNDDGHFIGLYKYNDTTNEFDSNENVRPKYFIVMNVGMGQSPKELLKNVVCKEHTVGEFVTSSDYKYTKKLTERMVGRILHQLLSDDGVYDLEDPFQRDKIKVDMDKCEKETEPIYLLKPDSLSFYNHFEPQEDGSYVYYNHCLNTKGKKYVPLLKSPTHGVHLFMRDGDDNGNGDGNNYDDVSYDENGKMITYRTKKNRFGVDCGTHGWTNDSFSSFPLGLGRKIPRGNYNSKVTGPHSATDSHPYGYFDEDMLQSVKPLFGKIGKRRIRKMCLKPVESIQRDV